MESKWAFRRMSSQPRLPFPGHKPASSFKITDQVRSSPAFVSKYKLTSTTALSPQDFTKRVSNFVLQNPSDWEEFILNSTKLETLKKWVTKKKSLLQEENVKKSDVNFKPAAKEPCFLSAAKQLQMQVSKCIFSAYQFA